ncbi:MAG TPA: VOC family protein [Polyangia bacterium]|jgi:predicted 3-demethylubiquinone-9 3-methyltransferase (glyoxalase superfamily)
MTGGTIVPCLWFDDQAEQAAGFYTKTFPDGRVTVRSRYPESSDNPSGKPRGSVLTVELEVAGQRFTALNGGPLFVLNPSISFFVHVDAVAEAERLFAALAAGGEPLMPLAAYPWSERYGWIKDRFGVSWQVMAGGRAAGAARIVPCLMFAGPQHGRAEAALQTWARVFPGGRVERLERYAAGEGPAGTIKHGRVAVGGQELIAMDSHVAHGITFNEAISLQVMCQDQGEVDRYWTALSEGGEPGPCGWLKDRFGVSWQVVPSGIRDWMTSTDVAARDRAFAAMMAMTKPDIAALQAAFDGK